MWWWTHPCSTKIGPLCQAEGLKKNVGNQCLYMAVDWKYWESSWNPLVHHVIIIVNMSYMCQSMWKSWFFPYWNCPLGVGGHFQTQPCYSSKSFYTLYIYRYNMIMYVIKLSTIYECIYIYDSIMDTSIYIYIWEHIFWRRHARAPALHILLWDILKVAAHYGLNN